MSYEVSESREIARPAAMVLTAAAEIITQLGGKRPKKDLGVAGQLQADFNKSVGGTSFNNRVQLTVRVTGNGADRCTLLVEAAPVDPLGQRLRFGVQGEPAKLVTGAFWKHLEARLQTPAR